MDILFSVVIPYYNKQYELGLLLKGLVLQDFGTARVEVILVDDGSDEDVTGFARRQAPGLEIRVIRNGHLGNRGKLRNIGSLEARGDFLFFLDSDMIPGPGVLREFHAGMVSDKRTVVLGTRRNMLEFDKRYVTPETLEKHFQVIESMPATNDDRSLYLYHRETSGEVFDGQWHTLFSHCFCIKKSHFLENGMFDESFGANWGAEDIELGFRLYKAGLRLEINEKIVCYHVHHGSVSREKINSLKVNYKRFIRKHFCWPVELITREYETYVIEAIRCQNLLKAKVPLLVKSAALAGLLPELNGDFVLFGVDIPVLLEDARMGAAFLPESGRRNGKITDAMGYDTDYCADHFEHAFVSGKYREVSEGIFHALVREAKRISKSVFVLEEGGAEIHKSPYAPPKKTPRFLRFVLGNGRSSHFNKLNYLQLALAMRRHGVTVNLQEASDAFNEIRINSGYMGIARPTDGRAIEEIVKRNLSFMGDEVPTVMETAARSTGKFVDNRIYWEELETLNAEIQFKSDARPGYNRFLFRKVDDLDLLGGECGGGFLPLGIDSRMVLPVGSVGAPRGIFEFLWTDIYTGHESNLDTVLESFVETFGGNRKVRLRVAVPGNYVPLMKSPYLNPRMKKSYAEALAHRRSQLDGNLRNLQIKYAEFENIVFMENVLAYEDYLDLLSRADCLLYTNSRLTIHPLILYSLGFGKRPVLQDRICLKGYAPDNCVLPVPTRLVSYQEAELSLEPVDIGRHSPNRYFLVPRVRKEPLMEIMSEVFKHPEICRMPDAAVKEFRQAHDWDHIAEKLSGLLF